MIAVFTEDELLPLSGLQHLLFCERQCALIHVEGVWAENQLTAEGNALHTRADTREGEERPGIRVARGLPLQTLRLGLVGRADVVEFHERPDGRTAILPVEYKRGRRRRWLHDEVQLCAQAIALEEMTGIAVEEGAIYYAASRRRLDVRFDTPLRAKTEGAAKRLHELHRTHATPLAAEQPKCRRCSLRDLCQPSATWQASKVAGYLHRLLAGGPP